MYVVTPEMGVPLNVGVLVTKRPFKLSPYVIVAVAVVNESVSANRTYKLEYVAAEVA
jgi:hypothetical protein